MRKLLTLTDHPARGLRSQAGATLVEVMFASAILLLVIAAVLSAQLMGMRLTQLVESKAGASDSSRKILSQLPADIRSAKRWNIGNLSASTNFTSLADGSAQSGTALQLFPTTNFSTPYILYYFDLSDTNNSNGRLMRTVNTNWNPVVLASNLINTLYFIAEDYTGKTATNQGSSSAYKNVIHTTLQYCQFQYPLTQVGSNQLYDYYKMDFKATPHLPE
jgi:Tfp pilus assembly protein PilW